MLDTAEELDLSGDDPALRLDLLIAQSTTAETAGDAAEAEEKSRQVLAFFDDLGEHNERGTRGAEDRRVDHSRRSAKRSREIRRGHRGSGAGLLFDQGEAISSLSTDNGARTSSEQGRTPRSSEAAARKKALELAVLEHGEDSLTTATVLENLGIDAAMVQDFDTAERHMSKALAILEATDARESKKGLNLTCNLSNLYDLLERQHEALELARNCRRLALDLDAGTFFDSWSASLLGAALEESGDLLEAEEIYRGAVDVLRETDKNHPRLPRALRDLADNLIRQGRYPQARQALEEAVSRRTEQHGEQNFRLLSYHRQSSELEWLSGRRGAALEAQEKMLVSARATPEPALPETLDTLEDHLEFLNEQGLTEERQAIAQVLADLR